MPSRLDDLGGPGWALSLAESADCGLLVLSSEAEIIWVNPWFCNIIGHTPEGSFNDCLVPDGQAKLQHSLSRLLTSGSRAATEGFVSELITGNDAGQSISVSLSTAPNSPDSDTLVNATVVLVGNLEAAEQERILLQEILHRTKNLLAIIQAMAGQTSRSQATKQEFVNRFKRRIQGLSATHDLLARYNWRPVLIEDLVNRQMHTLVRSRDERITVSGPELRLAPQYAQPLGLALHELLANAMQHGSLTCPTGGIAIEWGVEPELQSSAVEFYMSWLEHGDRPVIQPESTGFGTLVTTDMLKQSLSCSVAANYEPTGLSWRLNGPFSTLISGNEHASAPPRNY